MNARITRKITITTQGAHILRVDSMMLNRAIAKSRRGRIASSSGISSQTKLGEDHEAPCTWPRAGQPPRRRRAERDRNGRRRPRHDGGPGAVVVISHDEPEPRPPGGFRSPRGSRTPCPDERTRSPEPPRSIQIKTARRRRPGRRYRSERVASEPMIVTETGLSRPSVWSTLSTTEIKLAPQGDQGRQCPECPAWLLVARPVGRHEPRRAPRPARRRC